MKIKLKDNSIIDVQCQQYKIGLYVCIYKNGRMLDQFGIDVSKKQFLQDVKENKIFDGVCID